MKYHLFAGHYRYPKGGALDYQRSGTIDDLKQYFETHAEDIANYSYIDLWAHITDESMTVVLYGKNDNGLISWSESDGY